MTLVLICTAALSLGFGIYVGYQLGRYSPEYDLRSVVKPIQIEVTLEALEAYYGDRATAIAAYYLHAFCKRTNKWRSFTFGQIDEFYRNNHGLVEGPRDAHFNTEALKSRGLLDGRWGRDLYYYHITDDFDGSLLQARNSAGWRPPVTKPHRGLARLLRWSTT